MKNQEIVLNDMRALCKTCRDMKMYIRDFGKNKDSAAALVSGLWYGYILKGQYKWIIWPVGLIPAIILMILCGDEFSAALLVFEGPPVVAAFIGQMVGNMIWKAREKRRDKF